MPLRSPPPHEHLVSRLYLALLSSSYAILGKSFCLYEPIYLVYEGGLIMFIYLTNCCGASTRWGLGKCQVTGYVLWSVAPQLRFQCFPGLGSLSGMGKKPLPSTGPQFDGLYELLVSSSSEQEGSSGGSARMSLLRASLMHIQ